MTELFTPENLAALAAIVGLEVALGIDNLIFLSILCEKLPKEQQAGARKIGLLLAMFARLGLLSAVGWLVGLKNELFHLFGKGFTGKDLILLGGGLFLLYKASKEIYERVDHQHAPGEASVRKGSASYAGVMAQVVLMDLVFSIDSVLTAVGMTKSMWIMYAGVIISVVVMVASAGWIARVLEKHPSLKILAISFLMLIGVVLMAEGWDHEHAIPKGYIYTAMGFSIAVELLNIWTGGRKDKAAKAAAH